MSATRPPSHPVPERAPRGLPGRPVPVPVPVPPARPAAPVSLERARWVEARVDELPRYATFFYDLLLDRHLADVYKEQVFATLWYVLQGGELIPAEDADLHDIDSIAFAFRCLGDLVGRLPQAALAVHDETLRREAIDLHRVLQEVPGRLGEFYVAIAAIYRARVARSATWFKRAVETGALVRLLRAYVDAFDVAPWTPAHLERVEAFLRSFRLPARGAGAAGESAEGGGGEPCR